SLMFRREPVTAAIGFWDPVRFGADGEYVGRMRKAFGGEVVEKLADGPLALVRHSSGSLTSDDATGVTRGGHTVRAEYRRRFERWHERAASLRLERGARPDFPVPAVMRNRNAEADIRHDVVLASDFRLPGGTSASNVQEIRA